MTLEHMLGLSPVMPVVTIADAASARLLARALLAGGIGAIEITLRTPAALEAIRRVAGEVPQMALGAGTILTEQDAFAAAEAGAHFLVSPGLTPALAKAARDCPAPLLPGVATASEAMAAREFGFRLLKLFPAEAAGGRALLKSLAGPLPDLRFCPTGGISLETAPDYLALGNVICVGGSWIAPDAAIAAGDWAGITARARAVAALRAA
jgi:2-dehydro-3-deoxyphosphogluconate aldolase / (4S)-4-hydroxy-2-oxoglutarate aldolase